MSLLRAIKGFIEQHDIRAYSEHLSACADDGQLYDLMPLPFSDESVRRVAERVRVVQDVPRAAVDRRERLGVCALAGRAGRGRFRPRGTGGSRLPIAAGRQQRLRQRLQLRFRRPRLIAAMPSRRIAYLHMAGHDEQGASLKIDTHGAPVCDPVWELLAHAYACHGERPTLLERDFNLPPLSELYAETDRIRELQRRSGEAQLRSLGYGT